MPHPLALSVLAVLASLAGGTAVAQSPGVQSPGAQAGSLAALNPQPLPPVDPGRAILLPGREVMLNPQPLPPRWKVGAATMLNPQPLPPVDPGRSPSRLRNR